MLLQVLMHKMNADSMCNRGLLDSFWRLEALQYVVVSFYLFAYISTMLTQVMLSVTHYRAFTKLSRRTEDRLKEHEELLWPRKYGALKSIITLSAKAAFAVPLQFAD